MTTSASLRSWVLALALLTVAARPAPVSSSPSVASAHAPGIVEETPLERRTLAIAYTLRCLVCQGESVADSQAGLAADMRAEIRAKLRLGWSDDQIRQYFVARYGNYVLYRPPLIRSTWFLWFAPLAAIVAGIIGILAFVRWRGRQPSLRLSMSESERARALLRAHGDDSI
jgi:cytochrome c-type biogenesis protein CcmH